MEPSGGSLTLIPLSLKYVCTMSGKTASLNWGPGTPWLREVPFHVVRVGSVLVGAGRKSLELAIPVEARHAAVHLRRDTRLLAW